MRDVVSPPCRASLRSTATYESRAVALNAPSPLGEGWGEDVVSTHPLVGFATLNRNLRNRAVALNAPLPLGEGWGEGNPQPPNYALINSGAVPR